MLLIAALLACADPAPTPVQGSMPKVDVANPSQLPPQVSAVDPMGVYTNSKQELAPVGAPFACCDEPAATEALDRYVELNHAMAYDDLAGAKAAMVKLSASVKEEMPEASQQFAALADASADLQHMRDNIRGLAETMVAFARLHPGGTKLYRQAYCPMIDRNWIQVGDTVENPYYGAKMRNCGSFK
jgi:hypothetical protein